MLTKGGVIGTDFSPETSNSTPSVLDISLDLKLPHDYIKTYGTSPPHESTLTTQESKLKTTDRTENTIYSKPITIAYQNIEKVESRTIRDSDFIQSNIPRIYSAATHQKPVFYHPQNAPSIHEISTPIVTTYNPRPYDTNLNNLKTENLDNIKALPATDSEISSLNLKSSSSSLSHYSHPSESGKTTITYSDAPLVSHMTFKGQGVSYRW